jgi:hypothetical protein
MLGDLPNDLLQDQSHAEDKSLMDTLHCGGASAFPAHHRDLAGIHPFATEASAVSQNAIGTPYSARLVFAPLVYLAEVVANSADIFGSISYRPDLSLTRHGPDLTVTKLAETSAGPVDPRPSRGAALIGPRSDLSYHGSAFSLERVLFQTKALWCLPKIITRRGWYSIL